MGICCFATLLVTSLSSIFSFAISKDVPYAVGIAVSVYFGLQFLVYLATVVYVFVVKASGPSKQEFTKKYGKWAVVIGDLDNVYKSYAQILAEKLGLNLILVGQCQTSLEKISKNLPEGEKCTKIVVGSLDDVDQLWEEIVALDLGAEIGLLIENVNLLKSSSSGKKFSEVESEDLSSSLDQNCLNYAKFVNLCAEKFIERKSGLIVNFSRKNLALGQGSNSKTDLAQGLCQNFNSYYLANLGLKHKMDGLLIQSVQPYFLDLTDQKAVKNHLWTAFSTIGFYTNTSGTLPQHLFGTVTKILFGLPVIGANIETVVNLIVELATGNKREQINACDKKCC